MADIWEENDFLSDCYLEKTLTENIRNLFLSKLLLDVSLKTKERKICAHKLVLSACSKYFKALFTSDLRTEESIIDLSFLDGQALEAVINYFYTGRIKLNENNMLNVMEVEDMLCIGSLRPLISEAVSSLLSIGNSWAVWSHCRALGYYDLADQTFLFIRENFVKVILDSNFLEVPYQLLNECLESPHLAIPQEDILLKRLCSWITHDIEPREDYIESLLGRIDPTRLSNTQETIESVLNLFCRIEKEDLISGWVDDCLETSRGETQEEDNRYYEIMKQVVFVVGGECGRVLQTVECLPSVESPWRPTLPTHLQRFGSLYSRRSAPPIASLLEPRYAASACSSSNYVYVMGGAKGLDETEELESVERYNIYSNSWSRLPNLPMAKLYAAAVFTNNYLYLSGGLTDNTVSKQLLVLGPNSKSWRTLSPMIWERCEHNLVAVNGILYAVGGYDKTFKASSTVEKYDPLSDTWVEVAPMNCPRVRGGATVYGHFIYSLGGTAYIRETEDYIPDRKSYYERFDTLKNKWEVCGVCPNSSWSRVRSVTMGKVIISTTGSVGVSTYFPFTKQSSPGSCLLEPRRDHALVSLLLPVHSRPPL